MNGNNFIELKNKIIELLHDLKEHKNIYIHIDGIVTKNKQRIYEFNIESETFLKQISDCMEEIKILYKPLKSVYSIHSYGGKHYIEKYRGHINLENTYISNGEFILAM